jgi:hypothetical protein
MKPEEALRGAPVPSRCAGRRRCSSRPTLLRHSLTRIGQITVDLGLPAEIRPVSRLRTPDNRKFTEEGFGAARYSAPAGMLARQRRPRFPQPSVNMPIPALAAARWRGATH